MPDVVQREVIYISYYFMVQLRQIFFYWVLGMVAGSLISVFAKDAIHSLFSGLRDKKMGIWGIIPASLLGMASPLCMYGTIPESVPEVPEKSGKEYPGDWSVFSRGRAAFGPVPEICARALLKCGVPDILKIIENPDTTWKLT